MITDLDLPLKMLMGMTSKTPPFKGTELGEV